jgi:hypothetical protein
MAMVREAEHPSSTMHKKEFWNKCGNKLKHENEAEGPCPLPSFSCLSLFPHLIIKIQNSFKELLYFNPFNNQNSKLFLPFGFVAHFEIQYVSRHMVNASVSSIVLGFSS